MIHTEIWEFALSRLHGFIFFDVLSILTVDAFCPNSAATICMVLVVVSEALGKKNCFHFQSSSARYVQYQTFLWFLRSFAHNAFLSNPKLWGPRSYLWCHVNG
jgi:hypothetical protein